MGQAFTAVADDASAAYYNPAGLVQIRSPLDLTLGYQYAKPRVWVHMDPVHLNYRRGDFNREEDFSTQGVYLGYASNLADVSYFRDSRIGSRFAVGLVFFANLPQINQFWNPQWNTEPYVLRYNERWSLFALALSVGVRITDWFSAGAGLIPRVDSLQTATDSWIQIPAEPGDEAVGFRMNLRQVTKVGIVPIAGLLLRPPPAPWRERISLGFCYRGEISSYFGTGMQSTKGLWVRDPDHPVLFFDDPGGRVVDHVGYSPAQFTFALALKPLAGLLVDFDVTWKRYSTFTYFWDVPPDPPFHDVWIPRAGVCYTFDPGLKSSFLRKFSDLSLRAGYYREASPVPDMSGPMNILDADQNVVSAGFGVKYGAAWLRYAMLEAFFQAHLLEENFVANHGDPLYGPIATGGQVWAFGLALSLVF